MVVPRGWRNQEWFLVGAYLCRLQMEYEHWAVGFGNLHRNISDQEHQFESIMYADLMKLLGIALIRRTPYHPQANSSVEFSYRILKRGIMILSGNPLPIVLGATLYSKEKNAKLVYGKMLRLPGEFFTFYEEEINSRILPAHWVDVFFG